MAEVPDLDWLIVGGGIHGVHLAVRLLGEGKVQRDRLCIVDPSEALLARWRQCTEITGMEYLRSTSVHHLDVDANSLRRFAKRTAPSAAGLWAPPYDRPALGLFNEHCDHLIESNRLEELHVRDRVVGLTVRENGVEVSLEGGGTHVARHLILAIGSSEHPHWPDWAPRDEPRVQHVFSETGSVGESVAVVGGGISAAQVAVRLGAAGHRVVLVSRHELREHQFDSDPGWLGPKFMRSYSRIEDLEIRREIIESTRNRGSVPPDTKRTLVRSIQNGKVQRVQADVLDVTSRAQGLRIELSNREALDVDHVLLATGFDSGRPGGPLLDQLVESESLPCAHCGYPVVDSLLRWHRRIFVSGPLAELELGPSSRTIAGARRAGERIMQAVRVGRTADAV